jgi:hypothetical protein
MELGFEILPDRMLWKVWTRLLQVVHLLWGQDQLASRRTAGHRSPSMMSTDD